ncbi:MAG: aminoglycoside phosphotransferase family protein [Gammaproteobacteria bacterium]|nr:aminoglycoside phosphotransferase family protein [Gammaproteobacteria bacterium]
MTVQSPWSAEYELDTDQVDSIISKNTNLTVSEVAFLGEGWDFYNWLVNDRWVFRFPKRHSDIDTLVHERRILSRLELSIETPRFEFWVDRPTDFHKPFAGYPYLPGTPLVHFEGDSCNLAMIGQCIGEVLTDLHQQSLTPPRVPADPLTLWTEGFDDIVTNAKPDLSSEIEHQVRRALSSYRFRERTDHQVTTHNDLGVEHILMQDRERVAALIDWADCATANGFVDFAGIWAWGGNPALAATLDHYYVEPSLEDFAQIRIHGLCYSLEQIAYGRAIGDRSLRANAIQWVTNRAQDGELDDVYVKP